jgi:organic radical activating enzyme
MGETYPLAPQGVFWTVNGEGAFMGVPQVFVRFAGCPVGCPECDTDYSVAERVTAKEIVRRVAADSAEWVWLTGGEPTVHDLGSLVRKLRNYGYRVALATAGINPVAMGWGNKVDGGDVRPMTGFDFVSVSPHRVDESWLLRRGDQLNVVPGLNGLRLEDLEGVDVSGFAAKYVTPFWYGPGDRQERVAECLEWVRTRPGWRLGIQAHKFWGVA